MKYKQPDKPTFTQVPDDEYLKLLKDISRLAKQIIKLKAMKRKKK
jgi:hypothetical protein